MTTQKGRKKTVKEISRILKDIRWLQANGQTIEVMEMENDHLLHSMALAMSRIENLTKIKKLTGIDVQFTRSFGDGSRTAEEWLEVFQLELIRRDLLNQNRLSSVTSALDWLMENGIITNNGIKIKELKSEEE